MNLDLNNRSPRVERLPDSRLRVTRYADVINSVPKTPAALAAAGLWYAWGTPDATYPTARLIQQDISGQDGEFRKPNEEPPKLTYVFEEIPQDTQVEVGNPDISYDQYGNKTAVLNFVQFSAGTALYTYVVGTTAAPAPNAACLLKTYEETNDGTLRRKKLTFIDSGELSDTETIKFDGKLLLRELTYLGTEPPTPSGWTLVTKSTEFINGRQVYRYGYALGGGGGGTGGVISTEVDYERSPDVGVTGVTRTTIKYITDPSVVVNPITPPAGSVLISLTRDEQDGYVLWTALYASGTGVISSSVDLRYDGKLVIYAKTVINAGTALYTPPPAPYVPTPTIGGTVVLFSSQGENGARVEDGTVVFDWKWAEGQGEISRDIDYSQSTDQGATGVTKTTIKYLVAPGATVQPTSLAGSTLISQSVVEGEGYRIWTTEWAKGTGTVVSDVETKESGKLVLYHVLSLGLPPATPAATIGGVVTLTEADVRQADGYVIYDRRWAEGLGETGRSFNVAMTGDPLVDFDPLAPQESNALVLCTIRYLTAGTAMFSISDPTSGPAGFFRIEDTVEARDGYAAWTSVYARGNGTVVDETELHNGGKLAIYHRVGLNVAPSTPSATIGGTVTLFSTMVTHESNYHRYDYRWAEGFGVIDVRYQPRDGGLRLATWTSLGLNVGTAIMVPGNFIPPGIVVAQDQEQQDGYTKFVVSAMQAADGTSPIAGSYVSEAWIAFTYPGRARIYTKAFTTGGNGYIQLDVFLSPPTTALVKGTRTISYQLNGTLPSISPALWNPKDYATLLAQFVNASGNSQSIIKGLEGYGAFPAGTTTFSVGGASGSLAVLGQPVLTGTTGLLQLFGGPTSPDGSTQYTLHAEIETEPAFVDVNGLTYYRFIQITATPAAQAALPV